MMPAVVAGPPKCTLLSGSPAAEGHQKSHHATELVATMGEIAVVATGDEEHADCVQRHAKHHIAHARGEEDHTEGQEVHDEERDGELVIQLLFRVVLIEARRDHHMVARGIGALHGYSVTHAPFVPRSLGPLRHDTVISRACSFSRFSALPQRKRAPQGSTAPGMVRKNQPLSLSAATPGRFLPSRSSSDAPPPVETWLTLSSISYFIAAVAVSPPPMMVVAPFFVASTTACATALVPSAKISNSKTPTGPFQMIVLAFFTVAANFSRDFGPQSKPSRWAGIPDASSAAPTVASSPNLSPVT